MDLDKLLKVAEEEEGRLLWEGTFAQYLHMVADNPGLARLSHAYIYDMIKFYGVSQGSHGQKVYGLFKEKLFGLDAPLNRLVGYLASAAQRSEARHRILLLLGPPGSGKSSIVNLIKDGLAEYSRMEQGALYAIKGCPMQEDPLHLIPGHLRQEFQKELGVYTEGSLCPRCQYVLRQEYRGSVSQVPVRRVTLSERYGVGIGTHVSSELGYQNVQLLSGSVDTSLLGGDRLDVAGRAYRLDGELNVANRGLMEFAEIFKSDPGALGLLLGLAQEQVIKMGRVGSVYADEAIIAHSNKADVDYFASDPRTEALQDRIITIKIPYNLCVTDEASIYGKLLPVNGLANIHIAPLGLLMAATFAVLSRLEPSDSIGVSLLDKLHFYDGWYVPRYAEEDILSVHSRSPDEGMSGISPRYVVNRLSSLLTGSDGGCVTPLTILKALWDGLGEHIAFGATDQVKWISLLKDGTKQYDLLVKREVKKALVHGFEENSAKLFHSYWSNIQSYCEDKPISSSMERTMRQLEECQGITERSKSRFRHRVFRILTDAQAQGHSLCYSTCSLLRDGIEHLLFPGPRIFEQTLLQLRADEMTAKQSNVRVAVASCLVQRYGYCSSCADDLLSYACFMSNHGQALRVGRGSTIHWNWMPN